AGLAGVLGGRVESGCLEYVPASERPARDIHGQAAVRRVLAVDDLRPRLASFCEPDGFEMLQLLVREAVVDLRDVDLRDGSSDLRQAIRHVGTEAGVRRPGPVSRLQARGVTGPPDAADPDAGRVQPLRRAVRPADGDT